MPCKIHRDCPDCNAADPAAIEEAERIVDRMTCPYCMLEVGHDNCMKKGSAIVAALVAEGWGKK